MTFRMHKKCTCVGCRIHRCVTRYQRSFPWLVRRVLFVLWFLVCLEGSAWGVLSLWRGAWTTHADIWKEQEEARALSSHSPYALLRTGTASTVGGVPDWMAKDVLHPYLGFVQESRVPVGTGAYYGFREAPNTWLHRRRDDSVVIGIFGGSVANFFFYDGGEELASVLKKDPLFAGKAIELVPFSMGGWKQPQQLLALNYYLSLGGHLDIAVNLDGVNELVLPSRENIPKHVFPFYPRSWFFRIQPEERTDLFPIIGQLSYLTQKRAEWARFCMLYPLRASMTAGILWRIGDTYFARKIGRREVLLLAKNAEKNEEYVVTGPHRTYRNNEEALIDVVDYWQRASLLLHRMSTANNVQYFHFLQPNGRLAHAKPLTEEEHEKVFTHGADTFSPEDLINGGYPLLREAGNTLRKNGVHFTDLSRVFRNTHDPLYYDCCHVVPEGSKIMARAIAEVILQGLDR